MTEKLRVSNKGKQREKKGGKQRKKKKKKEKREKTTTTTTTTTHNVKDKEKSENKDTGVGEENNPLTISLSVTRQPTCQDEKKIGIFGDGG